MKKSLLVILLLAIITVKTNVFAATAQPEDTDLGKELKASYEKMKNGLTTVNVSTANTTVTIYGQSYCSGSTCTYTYAIDPSSTNRDDVLKKVVKCTNGEKYIKYDTGLSDAGLSYKNNNETNANGFVYWSEDIFVTCTSNNTEQGAIQLENKPTGSGSTTTTSTTTTTRVTDTGTGSTGGSYNTSTTTPNPEQGVETYYIIIGIIGFITYVLMVIVKKHNLFKKV